MQNVIKQIRQELKRMADPKTRESAKRFFKESVELYGIKTPEVNRLAETYFKQIKNKTKEEIFDLCEELWKSGFMEEEAIAYRWAFALHKHYSEKDFAKFEKWVNKYVGNWGSCDGFCNHAVGAFIERYPKYIARLKQWAKSKNRWMRRAAAVSLIVPAKKGMFLKDIFKIADILLTDKDDMVQKGYGWMLKEASHLHQKEVFDFVTKNKKLMPRTALRYAIEKFPEKLRLKAMAKD